jgi:hypothetical protein
MRGRRTWRPGSKVAVSRILFFVGILAVAGTIAVSRGSNEGGCVPKQFPDKWLEAQESAGGHTIARHVGKADQWLVERLAKQPKIHAASSFTDLENARLSIRAALSQHRSRINNWAASSRPKKRRTWDYDGQYFIGRVVERGIAPGPVAKSTDLKVVFEADGNGGCTLLTAYPIQE